MGLTEFNHSNFKLKLFCQILAISVFAYFFFHLTQGDRGYFVRQGLESQIAEA